MSAAVAAAAAAALSNRSSISVQNSNPYRYDIYHSLPASELSARPIMNRYETQKRRDWNSFLKYLKNHHRPQLKLYLCAGGDVVEFLRFLSQTKVQASSSDAIVGRLRVAFEENGGSPEKNPFCSRVVRLYLEEVKSLST